jgi:hypothetical protein
VTGSWRDRYEGLRQRVHPKARAFRSFLDGMTLDLDALPDRLPDLDPDDVIVCGCPRTGTSLCAAMLFAPPTSIAVAEPWDGLRLPPRELFASLRREIEGGRLDRGTLDLPALATSGRVRRVPEGEGGAAVAADPGFLLAVKWPSYHQLLPRMPATRFVVCVRDPRDTIASFKAIGGSVRRGYDYDVPFNRETNIAVHAAGSAAARRVALYDHVNEAVLREVHRPNVFVVRYERWFTDGDRQWDELCTFLGRRFEPGVVARHQESKRDLLDADDLDCIRTRCRTAVALGYDVDA